MFWTTGLSLKNQDLVRPSYEEMMEVHKVLSGKGLKNVVCQTTYGHIGPSPD